MTQNKSTWQEVAEKMQKHRAETIAKVRPPIPDVPSKLPLNVTGIPKELLSSREIELTETAPEELVASLASGKLTSTEITNAFLRRAGLASKLANCVTELLPEQALERAKYLDEYYSEHKKPIGPLHGLPISVKEHIAMKGLDLNAGFIAWVGRIPDESAHILQILWKAGCVFYVRTPQPQTIMHLETSNNLYGTTVNPFNRGLTSGGSSGGEGALIGLRGSCLGIGTDIGGSIRSPCANNGLYGFRPTTHRLPMDGLSMAMDGAESIVPVIGPMTTTLEGVKLFMKILIDAKPWLTEPKLLPFPWRDDKSYLEKDGKTKLKVAILWSDGVVKPQPPVIRAMKEVAEKLKGVEGVELVDWKPYKHDYAWDIISSLYFCDGAQEDIAAMEASGEPMMPLTEFILKNPNVKSHSIADLWSWHIKRDAYKSEYAQHWNSTATSTGPMGEPEGVVDVILCPVGPGPAPILETSKWWGYTSQWNVLDYPAAIFPVSKVDVEKDVKGEGYEPMNERDKDNYDLYDPETYRDAPVSLQLVGRRYDDEKVIEALDFIKSEIGLPFTKLF
ncbi:MAG: hypothetical protein M1827_001951 [Pycnora praestabilis]|nr:MAG: hypothetical protein M1827_001951 [Pycnora praestabilis]